MKGPACTVELWPSGKTLRVEGGAGLRDWLFEQGVEFPCGGRGRCRGCRVRVSQGELAVGPEDAIVFGEEELAEGWRLACRAHVQGDLRLEVPAWEGPILADGSPVEFTPRDGLGVAVDLGTTTVVAQLLDLRTGFVLGVGTALNAQAVHGADVMSRIEFAVAGGRPTLTLLIRKQVGRMVAELFRDMPERSSHLKQVVLVGNTVMHHLFCGLDVELLARHPFETGEGHGRTFGPEELGWIAGPAGGGGAGSFPGEAAVHFLPCLGGFVGSDLLAGLWATGLLESDDPAVLIDLGTNGEIVVGNREGLLCASTAAGPAFEGARIAKGMRAVTGAITAVHVRDGRLVCEVLGGGEARGICGSGLVDAVAAALSVGAVQPNGRIAGGAILSLTPSVHLTQCDIRELQLAKGAIAAGLRILLEEWGTPVDQLSRIHLAGAFGNYINLDSARRIGLLPGVPGLLHPAGNTALRGAKLALFHEDEREAFCRAALSKIRHLSLHENPGFQDIYAEEMSF